MNTEQKKQNVIPDYEHLFQDGAEQKKKNKASAIPKLLLKQNKGSLILSSLLFVVKASPTWAIPIVTAEIINIVSSGGDDVVRRLFIYGAILFVLLIQNIPTHILYSKVTDRMLRTVSAGMRNTLIRKLQHLSLTYHKEIESGKIQSKFLRDIETIEILDTLVIRLALHIWLKNMASLSLPFIVIKLGQVGY